MTSLNRNLLCAGVALFVASTAMAQLDDPERPFEPRPFATATSSLNFFWRECRLEAYPADPEAGVEKKP
ncbi:MAG: hypothetical protein GQE15_08265 [Archangiaceae bacterium]|nr:hypothetical protein [Archangiaceae bacterium]